MAIAFNAKNFTVLNYAAVCAKLRAMQAGKQTPTLHIHYERIKPYLYDKKARDFIEHLFFPSAKNVAYYLTMWKRLQNLPIKEKRAMRMILGTEIDLLNLNRMWRLKEYYGIVGDATYAYLIPIHHRLKPEVIAKYVACATSAELITLASAGLYKAAVFSHEGMINTLRRQYANAVRVYPQSLTAVCGYLFEWGCRHKNI